MNWTKNPDGVPAAWRSELDPTHVDRPTVPVEATVNLRKPHTAPTVPVPREVALANSFEIDPNDDALTMRVPPPVPPEAQVFRIDPEEDALTERPPPKLERPMVTPEVTVPHWRPPSQTVLPEERTEPGLPPIMEGTPELPTVAQRVRSVISTLVERKPAAATVLTACLIGGLACIGGALVVAAAGEQRSRAVPAATAPAQEAATPADTAPPTLDLGCSDAPLVPMPDGTFRMEVCIIK